MVYDENKKDEPMRRLKAPMNDKIFEVMSVGPWLYFFEYASDNNVPIDSPLHVINKETEEEIFQDKCFIGPNVDYTLGTNDQYILRLDTKHHDVTELKLETIRTTSQKELYVHLLRQRSNGKMVPDLIQHVLDAFEDD
jgi:hypothetical protein